MGNLSITDAGIDLRPFPTVVVWLGPVRRVNTCHIVTNTSVIWPCLSSALDVVATLLFGYVKGLPNNNLLPAIGSIKAAEGDNP